LHMNIAPLSQRKSHYYRDLVVWIATGLLAPEVLLVIAFTQWRAALELTAFVREKQVHLRDKQSHVREKQAQRLEEQAYLADEIEDFRETRSTEDSEVEQPSPTPRPEGFWAKLKGSLDLYREKAGLWTLQQSFFVLMGGIQVRNDHVVDYASEFVTPYAIVKRQDLEDFASAGLLHELIPLSKAEVQDRSKAQPLAKILSCLQAAYLLFTLLGRRVAHLEITELEITTLAHVLITLCIYGFWF
ncbi:hypothetical protein LTR66_017797, partial [Elasticomyces elasticus]